MNLEQRVAAIVLLPKIGTVDAIQFSRAYKSAYEVSIDWHEFSSLQDELYCKGILEIG